MVPGTLGLPGYRRLLETSVSLPAARRPHPQALRGGGRHWSGLLLIETMARAWGSDPSTAGKVVWFELAYADEGRSRSATVDDRASSDAAAGTVGRHSPPSARSLRPSERGEKEIDVSFLVPPEIAEAVLRLAELLTEADDYCRRGDLLTLAPPPASVAFRNWSLGEFVAQTRGADPTPWPEYRARALSRP
ncbi:MAG: hypothetical protein H0T70_03080 [Acidimicrobiia bacterium]|nr:hypothetical protein [Acidimicrobiia bacterium]